MMMRSAFLRGLAVLLLVPCAVLAGLAAYVLLANARPQPGVLTSTIRPQIVWPGQDTSVVLTVLPGKPQGLVEQPLLDLVLMVDVSGSMRESLSQMAEAAGDVVRHLAQGERLDVRFALIQFDVEAEVLVDWTSDPEVLEAGLSRLRTMDGENDCTEAFEKLQQLRVAARGEATQAVVFYTDGVVVACGPSCPGGPMPGSEIRAVAEDLRSAGVDLYSVGIPGHGSHPLMLEVTGSSSRVFDPADMRDLARCFRHLEEAVAGSSQEGARLSQRLDGRHFAAPLEGTEWQLSAGGLLHHDLGSLPAIASPVVLPIRPRSAGLWRVGRRPASLTYVDESVGGLATTSAGRRPLVLVVTWWSVLLFALPALLWLALHLPRRSAPPVAQLPLPEPFVKQQQPPSSLPLPPPPDGRGRDLVPTLFLGLGGAGRRAVHAARGELKQVCFGSGEPPYRFLWLDVDRDEEQRPIPFDSWQEMPIESLLAPVAITNLVDVVSTNHAHLAGLGWFDAARYHDAARDDLKLDRGAHQDRLLARLALSRWLEGGSLLEELNRRLVELLQLPSVDGSRQVLVFASASGGFGSGCVLDVCRLLQRLARDAQRDGIVDLVPEVICVLVDNEQAHFAENRNALAMEIRSALLTGLLPARVTLVSDHEVLDRVDSESPVHWVVETSGPDPDTATGQAAELAAVLTGRRVRTEVLTAISGVGEATGDVGVAATVRIHGLHVAPAFVVEQVELDLVLRLLGPDLLMDLEPSLHGGFDQRRVPDEEAQRLVAEWVDSEPHGTPVQLLLRFAQDRGAAAAFVWAVERVRSDPEDWLPDALVASLNRRLRGSRPAPDRQWQRELSAGQSTAVLELLAAALERNLSLVEGRSRTAVERVIRLARSGVENLRALARAVGARCEELATRRRELASCIESLRHQRWRTTLTGTDGEAELARWSQHLLERWLGSVDTLSELRERFHIAGKPDGDQLLFAVHSFIGSPMSFESADEAADHLRALARGLARGIDLVRLAEALGRADDHARRDLAQGLVERTGRPERVLLIHPRPQTRADRHNEAMASFCGLVPQPSDQGLRTEVASSDLTAVRRLEIARQLVDDRGSFRYVSAAEQEGERLRRLVESRFRIRVPVLPAELRVAVSHREAFQAFSAAYAAGRIIRRRDSAGSQQWFDLDRGSFLTSGRPCSLAVAAAVYVALSQRQGAIEPADEGEGDFTALKRWLQSPAELDEDAITLAVMSVSGGAAFDEGGQ